MNCGSQSQMPYADLSSQIQAAQGQQGQGLFSDMLGQAQGTQAAGTRQTAGAFPQMAGPFAPPTGNLMPITPTTQPQAMNLTSLQYLNGALRQYIGRKITVTLLIGTNTQVDRTGTLLAVGANYIVINEIETDDILYCDFYTIKFVLIYG